ncbi:MAG: general secretion pathway protein GspK, partial [Alphaproteobacteria bacterium]|nr:general secretion pathway protein GspK [Alphaproteobacteria bacterium]
MQWVIRARLAALHRCVDSAVARNERGVALIAVLAFLAVMSLLAIGIVGAARTTANNATRHLIRAQAQAAIESGIDYAANELLNARGFAPAIMSAPQTVEVGGFRVVLAARSEHAKIDLNFADQNLLAILFRAGGADPDRAQALASAVEDWRDADDLLHVNGAEKRQYEEAGLTYGPANKLFESVDELRLVLGVGDTMFNCLRPEVTIISQRPGVDIDAASSLIRRAAGIDTPPGTSASGAASVISEQVIAPGEVFEITARLE